MSIVPFPSPTQDGKAASDEFLTFRLGTEEYGIQILKVQEIRGYDAVTRIVGSPEFVKGVINLRGAIVPIVDLRIRFGLPAPAYDSTTVVIILKLGTRMAGIVVDAVSDVIALSPDRIQPAPDFGASVETGHIIGIANVEDRTIIVTDIDRLMQFPELELQEAAALAA